jgi:hypothetical protein
VIAVLILTGAAVNSGTAILKVYYVVFVFVGTRRWLWAGPELAEGAVGRVPDHLPDGQAAVLARRRYGVDVL